jgi:sporulation protein YlmC with PRC-barrel domain|tara:strand:+ start:1761 stop:2003 length:243 start_codon:yes stop_codon:yes gene_type:complete
MPTTFGREILGREVIDESGDRLGHMADFRLDIDTGSIVSLLVSIEPDLDPTLLPWPTVDGLISVPVDDVAGIGASVQLAR